MSMIERLPTIQHSGKAFHILKPARSIKSVREKPSSTAKFEVANSTESRMLLPHIQTLAIRRCSSARNLGATGCVPQLLHRCHQAIDGRTPEERWTDAPRPATIRYLARDPAQPRCRVLRINDEGDPNLPVFGVARARRRSAHRTQRC